MARSGRPRSSTDRARAVDRPFEKSVLSKAAAIARKYKIVLEFEDGDWYGHGLEMPGVFGDGKTVQAAVAETREALTTAVAYLLEEGRRPPVPAREGHRTEQVNVRLTLEEKALLETKAKARGFRGLSDFIRASALAEK
jgi:predicted RNase H-like HicB family nuclease